MKLNNIYIISWFGREPALAKKRRKIHHVQLEWCAKHNLHPVVFAQEYSELDYVNDVTYIKNTGALLHPGPARNQLLKHFYQSDDDFAVFADNDGVLYENKQHGDSANYIELMRSLPIDDFVNIDLIDPINPSRVAFSKEIATEVYQTHLTYRKSNKIKGTVFFLKNIKKYKDTDLFFDEVIFNLNGQMLPGEDTEFGIAALFQGLGCYYTYNAIVNELARNCSTWTSTNEHKNIVSIYESLNKKYQSKLYSIPEEIVKTFAGIGYSMSLDGKYVFRLAVNPKDRSALLEKYNQSNITFYNIPNLPVSNAMQYALVNFDDPILRDLLNEQIHKNKKFINVGKNRIKFNWNLVPMTIPLLPDKIRVAKIQPVT